MFLVENYNQIYFQQNNAPAHIAENSTRVLHGFRMMVIIFHGPECDIFISGETEQKAYRNNPHTSEALQPKIQILFQKSQKVD
jgi:hypothetical protein